MSPRPAGVAAAAMALHAALALALGGVAFAADPTADASATSAAAALASQMPVPALRNGTLGIPSVGGAGVSALVNNQIAANTGVYRPDFFAQIGRLQLSDSWSIDILGETFSAPVPTVALTPPTDTTPLPTLKLTSFQSIGFRLGVVIGGKPLNRRDASTCVRLRHMPPPLESPDREMCKKVGIDIPPPDQPVPKDADADKDDRFLQAAAEERASRGVTLMFGGRFLYGGNSTNPSGLAPELALQYLRPKGGFFVSASGLILSQNKDVTGPTIVQAEKVQELKLGLGGHLQFSKNVLSSEVLPRVGFYAALSRNRWTNEFAQPAGTQPDIRGAQLEASIYASGHFSGGFSGLIAFSVLRPYGHDPDLQYVLSIAPSLGTPLSK